MLLEDNRVGTYIDTAVVYPEIKSNPASIYSFLLMAGYLTVDDSNLLLDGNAYGNVYIPNKEVKVAYHKEIVAKLSSIITKGSAIALQQALISNDAKKTGDGNEPFADGNSELLRHCYRELLSWNAAWINCITR